MKLKWFLSLLFLNFSFESKNFISYGTIELNSPKKITNNGYCVYTDYSNIEDYLKVHIKVTVKNGYFTENNIYYGGYQYTPSEGLEYSISTSETIDSNESGTKSGSNYDYYTQHYYIRIENYESSIKYYFFSIPAFSGDYVEIELSTSGITIGAIIGIVFAGFFVSTLIIVIVCVRIKKKTGYNSSAIEATQPYTSPMNEYDSGNIVYNPHFEQANSN